MPRYIDADDLQVDCMRRYCGDCDCRNGLKCRACWVDDMLEEIGNAPTVSPDEVRGVGKWEDVSVHDNIRNIMIASMRCNVCKRYHNEVYHYGNPTEMARFCPVCGAKMEVSE